MPPSHEAGAAPEPCRLEADAGQGRLLAIGDIHGCLGQLEFLLDRVAPRDDDEFVFLGDYVDRGPDSRGVLDYLMAFRERYPASVFLRGNHEQMLLDYLQGENVRAYMSNGGWETLKSYETPEGIRVSPAHIEFIESMKLIHEREGFVFVHAGLRPGIPLEDQDEHDFLWIREEFLESGHVFDRIVVFGHTSLPAPLFKSDRIGLDTGAVYGRYLTCCDVRSRYCWDSKGCPEAA